MTARPRRVLLLRFALAAGLLGAISWGCGQQTPPGGSPGTIRTAVDADASPSLKSLGEIPADARVSDGGPDPRTPAYWITWSTCGAGSQADVARANGGRAAGWILLDDLLVEPGLVVGEHRLESCRDAVAVLAERTAVAPKQPADALARQVLAAELSLSAGSESCGAADTILGLAQQLLSSLGYDRSGPARQLTTQEEALASEAEVALSDYNAGTLCR